MCRRSRITLRSIALLLTCVSGISICVAEQTRFNRQVIGDQVKFSYEWLDQQRNTQQLSFSLNQLDIARLPTTQRNYQPAVAQRHVVVSLFRHARTYDPKQVRIEIKPYQEDINIEVSTRFPEKLREYQQQLRDHEKQAFQEYLYKNYYEQYRTKLNEKAIKPDHLRYVGESTRALIPLSQAIYEKLNASSDAREYINLMLAWIQSIPYSTLTDRVTTNGSGFLPPISLLNQNKGDCDSKTVLAAAIIRAFLPAVQMRIIFLNNHALLGVSLNVGNNDQSIMIDGIPFVLMEPTGPAKMKLGEIGDDSFRAINQGEYTTQSVQPAGV